MADRSLMEALIRYSDSGAVPMHMPGHKRNGAMLGRALPYALDITEIDGFDNLHEADGLLKEGMERARALYGARRTFYLVNGSTCGLLAGVRALTRRADEVLVMRGSHRSVYHAIELNGLNPIYLMPPTDRAGIYGSATPEAVEAAMDAHPNARLCVLTSPTYEGVISDIGAIADILHRRGAKLLVDEAHGAHLGLFGVFPESSVTQGADIVVQSLHKTLPSLTQTALLHVCTATVDADEVARQLSIFETSSPSYPLMASIDECVRLMEARGAKLFGRLCGRLDCFYGRAGELKHLKLLGESPHIYTRDRSKLVVLTGASGITGEALMSRLRTMGFELEMASPTYALAMATVGDGHDALNRLMDALVEIDRLCGPGEQAAPALPPPAVVMGIDDALSVPGALVPLESAIGRVSQEYLWAYPPGAPVVAPGERVTGQVLAALGGRSLHSTSRQWPRMLRVVDEPV